MKRCKATTYPERVLIFAILRTFCGSRKFKPEWTCLDSAGLARTFRRDSAQPDIRKPLSPKDELGLIKTLLRAFRTDLLEDYFGQRIAPTLQILWHQAPETLVFSGRIDCAKQAARAKRTSFAEELMDEARRPPSKKLRIRRSGRVVRQRQKGDK